MVTALPKHRRTAIRSSDLPRLELATPADDAALRALLHETPMHGAIDLAFLREPSYFRVAQAMGTTVQTVVARHGDKVVGVGTRALRPTAINGHHVEAGYLGDLRIHLDYRSTTLLARGYRFLRELHDARPVFAYSTVIVEDNAVAQRALLGERAGLPRYQDCGRILTPMIHLRRRHSRLPGSVVRGSAQSLPAIVDKLNENRMQFAPRYCVEDFTSGRFPGFEISDFRVLYRGGRIAGVIGVWNQQAIRQTVALAYHGRLRLLQPFVGWLAGLPQPGQPLRSVFGAFTSTDDTGAFRVLLSHVVADLVEGPDTHLIVGLHERDPRLSVLESYRRTRFAGRLFSVSFSNGPALDDRVPYVEAALL